MGGGKRVGKGMAVATLAATFVVVASGCAVQPQPIDLSTHQQLMSADRQAMQRGQEQVGEVLSLEEAIARAIKYNLEARVALMDQEVRRGQLNLARMEMLPRLAANAGFATRDNDNLVVSRNTVTGATSTDPTLSQDRTRETADLTLSWNILDFGVSYLQAKQNADEVLIAEQRRRRMANQIVQQVRSAYWRAATAEPLAREAQPLLADARKALADARETEARRLVSPMDSLNTQKGLIEVIRNLEQVERDLHIAKVELAVLMGMAPGARFSLQLPDLASMQLPTVGMDVASMEDLALAQRPELQEEGYQKRITSLESRKALLRMLPGLNLYTGLNYDSNSYLVNSSWHEAGARVSWNLLTLASGPRAMRLAEAREELGEARRLALGMAVISQVNIGHQEFLRKQYQFEQTRELHEIEQRILGHMQRGSEATAQSPLQLIRARLSALYAEVSLYQAYADAQTAAANLYLSMGMNPLPATVEGHDLETLKVSIGQVLDQWNRGDVLIAQVQGGAL